MSSSSKHGKERKSKDDGHDEYNPSGDSSIQRSDFYSQDDNYYSPTHAQPEEFRNDAYSQNPYESHLANVNLPSNQFDGRSQNYHVQPARPEDNSCFHSQYMNHPPVGNSFPDYSDRFMGGSESYHRQYTQPEDDSDLYNHNPNRPVASNFPSAYSNQAITSSDIYYGRVAEPHDDSSYSGCADTDSHQQPYINHPSGSGQQNAQIPGRIEPYDDGSGQLPPIEPPNSMPSCGCAGDRLCGVLVGPPVEKPEKVSSSHSKSAKKSKDKGVQTPHTTGPDGQGCGPLVVPGITPSPQPQPPDNDYSDQRTRREYNEKKRVWDKNRKQWKEITCPCGFGYFDTDGRWISGLDVRRGSKPPNPRWIGSHGRHPESPSNLLRNVPLYERGGRSFVQN